RWVPRDGRKVGSVVVEEDCGARSPSWSDGPSNTLKLNSICDMAWVGSSTGLS
ncbi:hypothetical protein A2U01_0078573, partial [Trifolium medium]|nr:hypothetical protein [Trifolium medium]